MSSLYGIGLSGLGAARAGLSNASNNIANVNTPGYTRRSVALEQQQDGGAGVGVTAVRRQYSDYLNGQLNAANSRASAIDSQLGQAAQINNLLGDEASGLAPRMQQFFSGLQTLADSPDDAAARESLLGDARNMTSQFAALGDYVDELATDSEQQMASTIDTINEKTTQIDTLNREISLARARGNGDEPNALLDKRDQAVADLGQLIDIKRSVQDGQSYHITAGGQSLVDSSGAHALGLAPSKADAQRSVVTYAAGNGLTREIDDDRIQGGALGGLIAFRNDTLSRTQQSIDRLAHTLSARVNEVHAQGVDQSGNPGQDFFSTTTPRVTGDADNSPSASLDVAFRAGESAQLAASDYRVVRGANGVEVTRLSDGRQTEFSGNTFDLDGLSFSLEGAPAEGDSFTVKALAGAAASLSLAIDDASGIAASQSGAAGDNRNAVALADLRDEQAVGGNRSFNDSYAQLVSRVGNATATLRSDAEAQAAVTGELERTQQSLSGVNLDEERVDLLYYQQMYQANARVIDTASAMFDTLLGLRR